MTMANLNIQVLIVVQYSEFKGGGGEQTTTCPDLLIIIVLTIIIIKEDLMNFWCSDVKVIVKARLTVNCFVHFKKSYSMGFL